MALEKYVSQRRLAYFKSKLDAVLATFGVKSVKVNGTALTPDANGAVDVKTPIKQATIGGNYAMQLVGQNSGNDFLFRVSEQENNVIRVYAGEGETTSSLNEQIPNKAYVDNKTPILTIENEGAGAPFTVGKIEDPTDPLKYMKFYVTANATGSFLEFEGRKDGGTPTTMYLASTSYVDTKCAEAAGGAIDFQIVADVASLPVTGTKGVFYLIPNGSSGQNVYDEYVWINKGTAENPNYAYENLGPVAVDLTGYVQESDLVEITEAEIDAMFAAA